MSAALGAAQACFRDVLHVSTAFLLQNVKNKREASMLLRVGRSVAVLDRLTVHLHECINQQRTLRSTFSLVQCAQDRRTDCLQPILLEARTTNVAALRTLCAQLDACLSELSELRKSLGQFYTHNTEVAAELFPFLQSLAAQKSTLAAVERALFDRLGALLSADESAYRECLQTHCSPLDSSSSSVQGEPLSQQQQQQQQQYHTTQHVAAAAAAAAAVAPMAVHSLPPPASPSLSQREPAVSTPAAAAGQQRTTPTSGTSHSSSTNTSSQLSSQLSPALVTVKQRASSSSAAAAAATAAAVVAVADADQQGNTSDGSGVLGITAPALPNSRLYAAAAPGFSQDSAEAEAAAASGSAVASAAAAAQQQQQQQRSSQQTSSNTTDGAEGEGEAAAAAADATETESEGGSQP
jgi:hypothetical protein